MVLPLWRSARTKSRLGWLRQALWSVLQKQTFSDFELIVVDDGSDDMNATLFAARQACGDDGRVRFIALPENVGQGAALNAGFAQALGDLRTFITDDNLWGPECFQRLVEGIDRGYDLVYGPFVCAKEGSDVVVLYDTPYEPTHFAHNCSCGIAFVFTRELHQHVGDFGDMWYADFDMWKRMQAADARILSLPPPPLAICYDHPDTVTAVNYDRPVRVRAAEPTSRALVWLALRARSKGDLGAAARLVEEAEARSTNDIERAQVRAAFGQVLS